MFYYNKVTTRNMTLKYFSYFHTKENYTKFDFLKYTKISEKVVYTADVEFIDTNKMFLKCVKFLHIIISSKNLF